MSEPTIPDQLAAVAARTSRLVDELQEIASAPTRGAVSPSDLALCRKAEGSAALLGIAADQVREAIGRHR